MSDINEALILRLKSIERAIERLKTGEKPDKTGWIPVSDTWTYNAANKINVPSGAASIYSVGMGFQLTAASSAIKKGYIIKVENTLLTVAGDALTDPTGHTFSAISYAPNPGTAIGFPVWFAYTLTPTAQAGTFTTVSAVGSFSMHGKDVNVNVIITITTNGTAATGIFVPLPVSADSDSSKRQLLYAREFAVNGFMGFGYITNSAFAVIRKYDNAYLGGDGYIIGTFGSYRAA